MAGLDPESCAPTIVAALVSTVKVMERNLVSRPTTQFCHGTPRDTSNGKSMMCDVQKANGWSTTNAETGTSDSRSLSGCESLC